MFFNNKFILASSSCSRYRVLKNNNLFFKVIKPQCSEEGLKKKLLKNKYSPKKISLELARLKSKSISKIKKDSIVVGSDTVIDLNGQIINKAKTISAARKKIEMLSGKKHNLYSSASVFYNNSEVWKKTQKAQIKIRKLSKNEIEKYLLKAGQQILNSAGCYQIEALGPNIIENIKGDFFNVMGFPLFPFLIFLKNYKIGNIKK